MFFELLDPSFKPFKGSIVCHVAYEDDSISVSKVNWGDGFESFLACCIPDLGSELDKVKGRGGGYSEFVLCAIND